MKKDGPQSTPQPTPVTNVTSFYQSGGITAHTVNIPVPPRTLNAQLKQQLDEHTAGRKKISVTAVMGDGEAFQFANEILAYLKDKGLPADGVNQSVFNQPVGGQLLNPKPDGELEIIIGNRQQ